MPAEKIEAEIDIKELSPAALYRHCDPAIFDCDTTDELAHFEEYLGQERAIHAIQFGVSMSRHGYNVFALGPSGTGKHTLVKRFVEQQAADDEVALQDWCYVNNFDQPYRPHALNLPAGMGKQLSDDMKALVEELQTALPAAFENEEYQARRQALEKEFHDLQQENLKNLSEKARERGLSMVRADGGLAFVPLHEGQRLEQDAIDQLADEERDRIQGEVNIMREHLQKMLYQVPRWQREVRSNIRELNREVANALLDNLIDDLHKKYSEMAEVITYLQAMQRDVSEHIRDFLATNDKQSNEQKEGAMPQPPSLQRYEVNVLVDGSETEGGPVIYESNPSYLNLVGRVEQMAQMGTLITDFTLIKPGALHRANGGYLIIDALKLLTSPYAWEGLKRALQFQEIRIESPIQMLSMTSTVSLEPAPIPLDIKVILIGDQRLYYLLSQADPEFSELFKVAADFDDSLERTKETELLYGRLLATIAKNNGLHPMDRGAICRVIEQSARVAGQASKLTTRMQIMLDLMEEAEYWAKEASVEIISQSHVQQALDAQVYRSGRISERMLEQVLNETILIDSQGQAVGQINGLAVIQMGNFAFGRPSRITASVRLGTGEVIDIEREVAMSGPLHAKGVLILSSYLSACYATDYPLSLSASIVFEQSYSGVDGDSASSTELYALLSAIADVPIRQSLAVTGSVNQHGQVQAIGGVNQKIEGFFDLCQARGLTGDQGVLIPIANVKHLMLRHDVVDAVATGQFHIYPVAHINQGIELLTGLPAGERDDGGNYPEESINYRVEERLVSLAQRRISLGKEKNEA